MLNEVLIQYGRALSLQILIRINENNVIAKRVDLAWYMVSLSDSNGLKINQALQSNLQSGMGKERYRIAICIQNCV